MLSDFPCLPMGMSETNRSKATGELPYDKINTCTPKGGFMIRN